MGSLNTQVISSLEGFLYFFLGVLVLWLLVELIFSQVFPEDDDMGKRKNKRLKRKAAEAAQKSLPDLIKEEEAERWHAFQRTRSQWNNRTQKFENVEDAEPKKRDKVWFPTPFSRGYDALKLETYLELKASDFQKLCPYRPGTYESEEWWLGFYQALRYEWYRGAFVNENTIKPF